MVRRLVFLLVLVLASVGVAPPALATAPTVAVGCDSYGADPGLVLYDCVAVASGGVGPYTFRWYRSTILLKTETTDGTSYWSNGCRLGAPPRTITVVVTDATGAEATATTTASCSA
ncbi:MAG TPA: hypothetical protein VGB14_17030 [Acidimicrobiales bacterium]|jgi:hypothetical protein